MKYKILLEQDPEFGTWRWKVMKRGWFFYKVLSSGFIYDDAERSLQDIRFSILRDVENGQ
jgi:hypothetical protein